MCIFNKYNFLTIIIVLSTYILYYIRPLNLIFYLYYISSYLDVVGCIILKIDMLYVVKDFMFGGYKELFLFFIYAIAILFGILVIISKNPIISVLFLIGLFLSISCYLILIGLTFIGLAYLLVYIGAVSILFLFILMLINVRISELLTDNVNSIPLAILLGSLVDFFINNVLPYMMITNYYLLYSISKNTNLAAVTSAL